MTAFEGSQIPDSDFAFDNGEADPRVRLAIAAYAKNPSRTTTRALISTLSASRLLVPVMSTVDSTEGGVEKDSHMSAVEYIGTDGRKAYLAFTGLDSLAAWDPQARPIPRSAHIVAQSVIMTSGIQALIIDMAGPIAFAIEKEELAEMSILGEQTQLIRSVLDDVCEMLVSIVGVVESARYRLEPNDIVITLDVLSTPADGQIEEIREKIMGFEGYASVIGPNLTFEIVDVS